MTTATATLSPPAEAAARPAAEHQGGSARLLRLEHQLRQAAADRETLRELLGCAQQARQAEENRGADPVVLCHHLEILSLLLRRLAETELRVLETRLDLERARTAVAHTLA